MNIAVVGGGPVGLYAATLLKHLYRDSHVRVFEKRRENQLTGFGYTVHEGSLTLLGVVDDLTAFIERGTKPFTRRTISFRGKHIESDPEVSRTMPIIGIEYDALINALQTQAKVTGVELHYESPVSDLDGLAQSNDLVVVANGTNSSFLERFHPVKMETALSYAWGKKEEFSDEMGMAIDTFDDIPFVCHKYPISKSTTVMIIEVGENHEAEVTPQIAQDPRTTSYFPEGAVFRKVPFSLCQTRASNNTVCIGDAAFTQYFTAGAGLYFGLMQTGLLLRHLYRTAGSLEQKLKAYDIQATDLLRDQWEPSKALIRKKQGLLAEYARMTDDAVLLAMQPYE
jgi:2-polyprenyl-6-methoxyphenol hydroxylase-like FAD-dependent oxidoreductase